MIRSYLINLERDHDRLAHMTGLFSAANLEFERIPAIDGRLLSNEEFQDFCKKHPLPNAATWGRGQIGCLLSHQKAWKCFSQSQQKFGTIFEDDLHISSDIEALLRSSLWIPQDADIIRFETSTNRLLLGKPVFQYNQRQLHKLNSTSWCAGAYIISSDCVKKLLAVPSEDYNTVDAFLFDKGNSRTAKTLNVYQFSPALCVQDKYFKEGPRHGFETNIHESETETLGFFDKISVGAIIRTLRGFKRVQFQA